MAFSTLSKTFLVFIGGIALTISAYSQEVVQLIDEKKEYELGYATDILIDPTSNYLFNDVLAGKYNDQFKKGDNSVFNFGYSSDDIWLRCRIKNNAHSASHQWMLEIGNPFLSNIEIYFIKKDGTIIRKTSSDQIAPDQREIKDRGFIFNLPLLTGEEQTIFIHAAGIDKKFFRVHAWEKDDYFHYIRIRDLQLGFYYGILLALVAYNLFLFFSILDINYLYYVIYITATCCTQMLMTGFAMEYIGYNLLFSHYHIPLYTELSFAFATLFGLRFLNVASFFPRLNKYFLGAVGLSIILFPFSYIPGQYQWSSELSSLLKIITLSCLFVCAIFITRQGYRPARYYLLGWMFLLPAALIMLLKHLGILSVTPLTQHAMKFGVSLEAILLSMGLADRLNTTTMQLKLKTLETEKLAETEKMKSDFFSNISHELRTPLSLIISPLEKLMKEKKNGPNIELFQIMHRNATRLLQLVNHLLDLSKLDSKAMKLNLRKRDVITRIKVICSSFESVAFEKQISFSCSWKSEEVIMSFDEEKVEIILYNLLANAFKFTPTGGIISVTVQLLNEELSISIKDSGIGIAPSKLPRIYDRFYQVNNSSVREFEGTGIGLALVKELVELHHGFIEVQSELGKGTEFIVRLPMGISYSDQTEPVDESLHESFLPDSIKLLHKEIEKIEVQENEVAGLPILLLVEDNTDFRIFSRNLFTDTYQVIEATDGEQGWEKALEYIPDLIITDMMMPKMDGTQLCKKIKEDIRTSHIPVIILTARQSTDSKVKGFETGADDYIAKPFREEELHARVKNLIAQREKLREIYQRESWQKPQRASLPSANEKFLDLIVKAIEANIASGDFNVEQLGKEIGMSRTQIFKKLKALTGQSPSDFIKIYKLNKAAHLLSQKTFPSIAEVAYACGFNSPSHFTESFRKQFGKSPSEFARQPI